MGSRTSTFTAYAGDLDAVGGRGSTRPPLNVAAAEHSHLSAAPRASCTSWAHRPARRHAAHRMLRVRGSQPDMATDCRPARRRGSRRSPLPVCGHPPSGRRQRSDAYRRQGRFSVRGVDLILAGRRGTHRPSKRVSESDFELLRCLHIGSCRGSLCPASVGRGQHHVVGVHLNCCHLAVDGRPERPVPLV